MTVLTFSSEQNDGNSGAGTKNIDWTTGNNHLLTLTGNPTLTFTTPPGTTGTTHLTLRLVQDATGGRTITWPATVKWIGSSAPTLSTAANAVDIVTFYFNGTNYYGSYGLNFG